MMAHHGDPFRPQDPPRTDDRWKDGAICREVDGLTGELRREFYCTGTPPGAEPVKSAQSNAYVVTPSVPTTDVVSPSTTVEVASRPSGELPRTGGDLSMVVVALFAVAVGVLCLVARRWAL